MADLVSIVIPAYNAARYIRRSLQSALDQSWSDIEIIVVDDGSTDSTADIVKSYDDPRIRYIYQKNQGQGAARNNGIKNSMGNYITLLDADDSYLPRKVEKQYNYLLEHPEHKVVYCNALHFYSDRPDRLFRRNCDCPSGDIFESLLHSSLINPNTVMFANEVARKGCLFREGVHGRYCEEWDFYFKLTLAGFHFGYIDEDLVIVEIRKDSNTQWDKQWVIKKNSIDLLEAVFSRMTREQKVRYDTDRILRTNKLKLAVAYLLARMKKESADIIADQYPDAVSLPINTLLKVIPAAILGGVLAWLWKTRQRSTYRIVDNHRAVNTRPGQPYKLSTRVELAEAITQEVK